MSTNYSGDQHTNAISFEFCFLWDGLGDLRGHNYDDGVFQSKLIKSQNRNELFCEVAEWSKGISPIHFFSGFSDKDGAFKTSIGRKRKVGCWNGKFESWMPSRVNDGVVGLSGTANNELPPELTC